MVTKRGIPGSKFNPVRKVPPSRIRYEEQNPVVSFRITKQQKERFQEYLRKLGISRSQFLKEVLDKKEAKLIKIINKAKKEGYDNGYQMGYGSGYLEGEEDGLGKGMEKTVNVVIVKCSKCKKDLTIDLKNIPQARQLVEETLKLWHHGGECPK